MQVYLPVRWFICFAAGDLLHVIFVIDMLEGWQRGDVGGGGVNGLSSNSVCIAKGFIHKAYTLQRYSDKESQILIQLDKSLKVSEPQRKGMHSLYEPVHEIWTYRISTTASNNRLFWRV